MLFGLGRLATYVLLGATAGALGGELLDALPAPAMTVGLALADKLRSYLVYAVPQQFADRVSNGEFRCPDSDIAD